MLKYIHFNKKGYWENMNLHINTQKLYQFSNNCSYEQNFFQRVMDTILKNLLCFREKKMEKIMDSRHLTQYYWSV